VLWSRIGYPYELQGFHVGLSKRMDKGTNMSYMDMMDIRTCHIG
jgi:hypothetical protein